MAVLNTASSVGRVLVVNAGSSSLKLRLLDAGDRVVASADVDSRDTGPDGAAIGEFLDGAGDIDAVGHRIVHGGSWFTGPVRLDGDVRRALGDLVELAPLHQPRSLAALDAVTAELPDVPAVASFDTAFHATMPDAAYTYAVPRKWREHWGIRRFGFHGLSHAYASHRAADMLDRAVDELRVVTCHLGAGASLAAVSGGRSIATTMGFTPLEGVVMATRSGDVDPGALLWLVRDRGVSADEIYEDLEHHSGLAGLAGTADMRDVVAGAERGDADCVLALEVYLHRLRAGIAAMAAAMGGLDVLVFTGGVGENAAPVRSGAARGLEFLGVGVDEAENDNVDGDVDVSSATARVRTLVVAAREDLWIAREVRSVLGARG